MKTDSQILIDFEKIKDPYSGLGQFCAHLKLYFDKSSQKITYWIPNKFEKMAKRFPFLLKSSDVFHAVHQDSPYIPRSKKTKYILTIHDLNALYETNDPEKKKLIKKELQKKINRSNIVTFISEFTKQEVENNFNLTGKQTQVIYNGISLTQVATIPPLIPDSKFIFAIGTVLPKKNFMVLIDFLKELPLEYKIVLAGTTFHQYAKDMQDQILKAGIQNRFFLIGTITEEEKYWYYQHATAFIFPSLLEGFGLPVAEAMSMGLPLFLSDKTSLPEIGGEDAYYFKNFEATYMREVFLSGMEEFSKEKKARLIERSKLFNWEVAASSYLALYRSI